ncbi:hypothetical protein QR680_007260 [Steinernema hermaphroditum]|uniref:GH18 domain-containing protein n=1 Tax=Steinernema hermaphroditum TaxID=289476 RepID=A0AA39I0S9_9BILA|nr:hypothetical protein QR680_007260 [Steinernema hermaphroditum]
MDGIEISWTLSTLAHEEAQLLCYFLQKLRRTLRDIIIVAKITSQTALDGAYNMRCLNRNTDYVVLQDHHLNPSLEKIGQHPTMLNAPNSAGNQTSLSSFVNKLSGLGLLSTRMLLGVSAEGIRMNKKGAITVTNGTISQKEICYLMKSGFKFLDDEGVATLYRGNELVTFDNKKKIKKNEKTPNQLP